MSSKPELTSADNDRAVKIALLFALVAERTSHFYEHSSFAKDGQYASLAASWLLRAKRSLLTASVKHLVCLSEEVATQITTSLSREAGLFVSYELQQALDPNYQSEVALTIMGECEQVFLLHEQLEQS